MEQVTIEKLDNLGRGISFINNKITFIDNTLPNEEVLVSLTKEKSKYNEAKVEKYLKLSDIRTEPLCPYFNICDGCKLQHMSYQDTLIFKKDKLNNILSKYANITYNVDIIPSDNTTNYRNKISLKIKNSKYGYYKENTNEFIKIDNCLLAEESIMNFIKDIKYLNIKNGNLTIRSNYNKELLIIIDTKDDIIPNISKLKDKHKIVGIIINNKTIYGNDSFVEVINKLFFNVSYDSFFQINRNICSKLFNLINKYITNEEVILDLYCGVGTLGINCSKNIKRAYGIEIVKNAILNAITNSKINKRNNIEYMLGDVSNCLPKIKDKVDTIIVDPPRSGLDNTTINTIIKFNPNKIIYVSCDPMTLARDLKILKDQYNIINITALDMFPYTYHVETFCVLERK